MFSLRRSHASAPLLVLAILAMLSCDAPKDQVVQPQDHGWTVAPRIEAGTLTEAQIGLAQVVLVSARMETEVVASKEVRGTRTAVLRIPRRGSVEIRLEAWRDSAKTVFLWSGSCVASPEGPPCTATLKAESGLRVLAPRSTSTIRTGKDSLDVYLQSDTKDAEIFYTIDGTDPLSSNALVYDGKITLFDTARIRAVATLPNYLPSEEWNDMFLVAEKPIVEHSSDTVAVPTATIQPMRLGDSTLAVVLTSATAGSTIRYTLDETDPTASASTEVGLAPVTVKFSDPGSVPLRFLATREGMIQSDEQTTAILVPGRVLPISMDSMHVGDSVLVVLSCPTADAQIRYTTDGSDPLLPASGASLYTDTLKFARTIPLRSVGVLEGSFSSRVRKDSIVVVDLPDTVAQPTATVLTVPLGDSVLKVILATTTAEVSIRYTLDGSSPSASSSALEASAPVTITLSGAGPIQVRAIGTKEGWVASPEFSQSFTIPGRVVAPVLRRVSGYDEVRLVLESSTPGASIFYTTNDSDPLGPGSLVFKAGDTLRPKSSIRIRAVATANQFFASKRTSDSVEVLPGWNWNFDLDSKDSAFLFDRYSVFGMANSRSSSRVEVADGVLVQNLSLANEPGTTYSAFAYIMFDWSSTKGPRDLRDGGRISFVIRSDISMKVELQLLSPLKACVDGARFTSSPISVSSQATAVSISLGDFMLPEWAIANGQCDASFVSVVDPSNPSYDDTNKNLASALTGVIFSVQPAWDLTGSTVKAPVGEHRISIDSLRIVP